MVKLKREEAEKQEKAALSLAKKKHKTAMRKKEHEIQKQLDQMAIQELEEEHRQRIAAGNLNDAELMDNCSFFSHHSSELNVFKDRGSFRGKKRVEDWVNWFLAGKTRTASSEPNSSRLGSETNQPLVQDTAYYKNVEEQLTIVQTINQAAQMLSDLNAVIVNGQSNADVVQTDNLSKVAGNSNHLEILSQYTVPGVAFSIAQQEALYRECLHAQMQQYGNNQRVGQANSESGSGVENPLNKVRPPCKMSQLHQFCHLWESPGHLVLYWHQQIPFLYLTFQQTHS